MQDRDHAVAAPPPPPTGHPLGIIEVDPGAGVRASPSPFPPPIAEILRPWKHPRTVPRWLYIATGGLLWFSAAAMLGTAWMSILVHHATRYDVTLLDLLAGDPVSWLCTWVPCVLVAACVLGAVWAAILACATAAWHLTARG